MRGLRRDPEQREVCERSCGTHLCAEPVSWMWGAVTVGSPGGSPVSSGALSGVAPDAEQIARAKRLQPAPHRRRT